MDHNLTFPLKDEDVLALHLGDEVLLSGYLLTARDAAHKWLLETFIENSHPPSPEDQNIRNTIAPFLDHGAIYHCGPIISGEIAPNGSINHIKFISAGPTTSIREEIYTDRLIKHFHVSAIIGKGGMGANTLAACQQVPAVYLHAIGGAGTLIAQTVQRVQAVYKPEFGIPEAIWIIEVKAFPAIVTMDAHGRSLHTRVAEQSREALEKYLPLK
ncbi:MAG: FumA C-terminus/TtdB family hydratase beta subunit [Anaerolineaceae bacterium]|jgi:fumarate hydratase class I|nr:FumA C-terminus/TtdB family hydratase beta subunit [Anaerolineaceae bacterium]